MSRQKPSLPPTNEPCGLPVEDSSSSFWHSQPSPLLTGHRSTRNLPATADVVIIGSGITGTSAAHHLLTLGHDEAAPSKPLQVVMLEAREACWGATGRNGGHCQPLFLEYPNDPSVGRFELANFHALESLIRSRNIDCEFVSQPGVRAIYTEHHLDAAASALKTLQSTDPELAQRVHIVQGSDNLRQLRCPTALGAVVTNIAARLWPYKFVASILESLLTTSHGPLRGKLNLQTLTPATSISHSCSTWTITTPRGTIATPKLILASNAYTSHILPSFADLIVPCRGQMSALLPTPSLQASNRLSTSFGFLGDGIDDYLIQRPSELGGHLMFGGGRQHEPSVGTVDDSFVEDSTALYLRRRLVFALGLPEKKMHRPGGGEPGHGPPINGPMELKAENEWTGIMGFSRDDLPWIGAVPEQPEGLYIAAGFTGHGMPNTWLCGGSVARLVLETMEAGKLGCDVEETLLRVAEGLPKAYVATAERVKRARAGETVQEKNWADMERGRLRGVLGEK
ncbi:DAO-domain-containing protein [Polychaeton citri CBS 116435]|uniref:DAO-domain-containing protein n=1 Tax=Polychaeton citri CBS 116435 TaxID=1314669 RepID=A0A9P4UUR3_9PEZI|nr:DAO-domain-containing protein [Polychaeton citri CBS 116435]